MEIHENDKYILSGVGLIAAERIRQMKIEGWTPEHDDEHKEFELSRAARVYSRTASCIGAIHPRYSNGKLINPADWPLTWHKNWWKPEPRDGGKITKADSIRMLVKAGALIAAEIDRLQRMPEAAE